jgi:hypothetical protein
LIVVSFHAGGNTPRDSRGQNSWPKSRGKFLHFVLHKVDAETSAIFSALKKVIFSQSQKERLVI